MDRFRNREGSGLPFKTKCLPAFLKEWDEDKGELEGFAAITGFPDAYREIIDPGAFSKTLRKNKGRIAICWQHNWREPIGKPSILREVGEDKLPEELTRQFPKATGGLYFKGRIVDTRQGQDAKVLIREGVVSEMSIGYDLVKSYQGDDDYLHLEEIELFEISPVTMAAMPAALVTDYKDMEPEHLKPEETEDYIHIPIRDAGDFVADSFRTIDLAKDQGIKAVIGKLKSDPDGSTHIQKCVFDKAKGWTMAKAQAWVKEHREELKEVSSIWQKSIKVIELLEKGEFKEANRVLTELISELPKPALGLAEELALRARVLEAETTTL